MQVPAKELNFEFARSGGPGGQNVNKVNSKVCLRWNLGKSTLLTPLQKDRFRALFARFMTKDDEVQIESQRFRSQARNIADTTMRLSEMIDEALIVPKKRKKSAPTKSSIKKRLDSKRQKGEIKKGRSKLKVHDF